jgi:hypothetical protein
MADEFRPLMMEIVQCFTGQAFGRAAFPPGFAFDELFRDLPPCNCSYALQDLPSNLSRRKQITVDVDIE